MVRRVDSLTFKTPETDPEWNAYHRIREHVLWELRGQFGVYDRFHPEEDHNEKYPKILLLNADPIGVVRVDFIEETEEAAFRKVAIIPENQRKGANEIIGRLCRLERIHEFLRECLFGRSRILPKDRILPNP